MKRISIAALLLFPLAAAAAGPDPATISAYIPKLEKNLKQNILAFWRPRSIDKVNGGYMVDFDAAGTPKPGGAKMIVTQARMVWFYARMARAGYGGRDLVNAADHGYHFLREKMWDAENGGFYWLVNATGNQKLRTGKHLYGQAFALYALAELYQATGRQDVLEFANQYFTLLDRKAHDETHGGYLEFFDAAWKPATERPYVGGAPGLKLMNTHLHLMEALSAYYRVSKSPLAQRRLFELITIGSSAMIRKGPAAGTDKYERDWTPRLEGDDGRVSYGHDLENIWLMADSAAAAGISPYPLVDLFKAMFAYSMKFGWDRERGGFFDTGLLGQPADRRNKIWWVQAECLVGALSLYRLTRDPQYFEVFEKTWDFIDRYQTDWTTGEWHNIVTPEGVGRGDKGSQWKAAYHNGRAMIECLGLLKGL